MSKRSRTPLKERACDLCLAPAPWAKYTIRREEQAVSPTLLRFCSIRCLREWIDGEAEAEEGMPIVEALRETA